MSDTFVTIRGWVGTEVGYSTPNGLGVANFRVGATPRLKRKGEWVDGETTWYSVKAWRALGENVRDSIRKGDPVIVHGRLRSETWERADGQLSTSLVVEASFVGHDLSRGTSAFTRAARPERVESDVETGAREVHDAPYDVASGSATWNDPAAPARMGDPGAAGPGGAAA